MTGVGLVSPLGIGTEANWEALCAGPERHRPDHALRRVAVLGADRRRGQGLRPAAVHRARKTSRRWTSSSSSRSPRRSSPMDDAGLQVTPEIATRVGVFIASGIGGFSTIEREHKALHRGRSAPHLAVLHPRGHHQPGRRPGLDPLRRQGPELGDLHRLLRLGARHRRRVRDHPPRRRRRDDRRRLRGGDHADGRRRVRGDARAVDAQRRARSAPAVRSTRTATASSWARAPASSSSRSSSSRSGAARRSTPSSSATACPPTRTTSPRRPRTATAACASCRRR